MHSGTWVKLQIPVQPMPPPIVSTKVQDELRRVTGHLRRILPEGTIFTEMSGSVHIYFPDGVQFDKPPPYPRDQLIVDLIKAGNDMFRSHTTITGCKWREAVRAAAESLFDGIVPEDQQ